MDRVRIKFNGSFSNKFPLTLIHSEIVNIYIVYEITINYSDSNYPILKNCLFGSVKLTKNADIDIYGYSGYGVGFDGKSTYWIGNEICRNVIIFGVDMGSSTKIYNRKKEILIFCKGPVNEFS